MGAPKMVERHTLNWEFRSSDNHYYGLIPIGKQSFLCFKTVTEAILQSLPYQLELTNSSQSSQTSQSSQGGSSYSRGIAPPPAFFAHLFSLFKLPSNSGFVVDYHANSPWPCLGAMKAAVLFALDNLTPTQESAVVSFICFFCSLLILHH